MVEEICKYLKYKYVNTIYIYIEIRNMDKLKTSSAKIEFLNNLISKRRDKIFQHKITILESEKEIAYLEKNINALEIEKEKLSEKINLSERP